eukprot:g21582.t1
MIAGKKKDMMRIDEGEKVEVVTMGEVVIETIGARKTIAAKIVATMMNVMKMIAGKAVMTGVIIAPRMTIAVKMDAEKSAMRMAAAPQARS